jgi:ribonuclease Z
MAAVNRPLKVKFLGTGGSITQAERFMNTTLVQIGNDKNLVDCGEGASMQLMRSGAGMQVDSVFITHFHTDHVSGITMLLHNLAVFDRDYPLKLYGPAGMEEYAKKLPQAYNGIPTHLTIEAHEVKPGDVLEFNGYKVEVFKTYHRLPSVGYAFVEGPRSGKFNVDKALELGLKPGPDFGKLQNGEAVTVAPVYLGGLPMAHVSSTVYPEQVLGPLRPGRKVVFTGDTMPNTEFLPVLKDADLWVSEGTYTEEFRQHSVDHCHTVVGDAAKMATTAGVKRLVFNHITPRYGDVSPLVEEAAQYFRMPVVAADMYEIELPFE